VLYRGVNVYLIPECESDNNSININDVIMLLI